MRWWQWAMLVFLEGGWAFAIALLLTLLVHCHGDEYEGWIGRWENVVATAYTPIDPIDDSYHATKGERWRWVTANGHTDVRRVPYGVAVPLRHGQPWWAFGTRLIIPVDTGYLVRCRGEDREFRVDDVGNGSEYFPTDHGRLHIDLRFIDRADAIRWAGPDGKRAIRVFICQRRAPEHIPVPTERGQIIIQPIVVPPQMGQEPWPEPLLPPEPPEVLEASLPMTDLMVMLVPVLWIYNRHRRRASWEPRR